MSSIIAIVGRPNVGKSTLFNRIVGARDAIVHNDPGVTRDRHYAMTEWTGKTFTLIDTGGYVPQSLEVFEKAIREQAEIAIEEATSVIFVVDGEAGVTPLDEEIAAILRTSNKQIHLVVNKIDNDRREAEGGQFFRLGLGEPITVSALGGRNIGDFLDRITEAFSAQGEEEPGEGALMRLAVVGRPNVGKSSFINALLGKSRHIVTPLPGTTRDSIDSLLKHPGGRDIVMVDTAGLRRKSRISESVEFYSTLRALKSIDQCDVAVLLIEAPIGMDRQDLRIMEAIAERRKGTVLAVNKWDLIEKDTQTATAYEKELRRGLRIYDYVPIVFISALSGQRVHKAVDLARTVHEEQSRRIPTNKLNAAMLKVIAKSPPSSASGKEIKIKYVTQVKTNPPAFTFFMNEPKLVEDNYRRFLERKLREFYGFTGVPIIVYCRKKRS